MFRSLLISLLLVQPAFAKDFSKSVGNRTQKLIKDGVIKTDFNNLNLKGCIQALNVTETWKNKVIPLDDLGHTFLIKVDNVTMKVIGEKSAFTLTTKPDCTTHVEADPIGSLQALFNIVAAKEAVNKRMVWDACKEFGIVMDENMQKPGSSKILER